MHATPLLDPRSWSLGTLLRAIDRPALAALELGRRPVPALLAPGVVGLVLLAATSSLAGLLDSGGLARRLDTLRAALEALAVVLPATVVFGTWLRLRIAPATMCAAISLSLLVAGLTAMTLLPLLAFLAVVSDKTLYAVKLVGLLLPGYGLAAFGLVLSRVFRTLDPSPLSQLVVRGGTSFLLLAFLFRAWSSLR